MNQNFKDAVEAIAEGAQKFAHGLNPIASTDGSACLEMAFRIWLETRPPVNYSGMQSGGSCCSHKTCGALGEHYKALSEGFAQFGPEESAGVLHELENDSGEHSAFVAQFLTEDEKQALLQQLREQTTR